MNRKLLESIDLDGEGRIRKVGDSFTYDYYVKDHLGSTREVINDEGAVTEATMYYPYGTMETLLKPPVNDNAREKFTGKELDAGENPASEVSFIIAINNFDAGMHYHGELYVNYTDLVYNRSFLKVYPLQYDADADKFILNTADRFPDSMRVTNLRIATSRAVSPINYEKACDYTVITDSGLAIALDTSGSALINSSGVNYFTDSTYTPERVAGSNLYYFGARYYDAELGVWGSTDPDEQDWNTYLYCANNPVFLVDPNGRSWKAFWRAIGIFALDAGVGGTISSLALGAGATIQTMLFDPALNQTAGAVNNVIHNWEGIRSGEGRAFDKFLTSFTLGSVSGTADWLNSTSFGLTNESLGAGSGSVLALSHNQAFDKDLLDREAYEIAIGVLTKMYNYGVKGSAVKIGSDVQWSYHLNSEEPSLRSKYDEARNRYSMMKAKIYQRDFYVNGKGKDYSMTKEGNNDEATRDGRKNKIGHRTLGKLFGGKLSYYGFEVWGEPYEEWNHDDYQDDFWTDEEAPENFNYWTAW